MTRKHFQDIADAIGRATAFDDEMRDRITDEMVSVCRRHNANFDQARFLHAIAVATDQTVAAAYEQEPEYQTADAVSHHETIEQADAEQGF